MKEKKINFPDAPKSNFISKSLLKSTKILTHLRNQTKQPPIVDKQTNPNPNQNKNQGKPI
jgi:hypothetical protein